MERIFRLLLTAIMVVSLSFLAGGCARKSVSVDGDVAVSTPPVSEAQSEKDSGMAATEESLDTAASSLKTSKTRKVLEGRTSAPLLPVYFDFDKSNVRKDQVNRIRKNVTYLKANPTAKLMIEGNCDERGTNEYNLALGERRALSAKKYMKNLGVAGNRLRTISYGEARPLLHGHDEYSWAQNRRDDFVIE